MKGDIVSVIRGMVLAVLLISTLTPGLVSAQDESKSQNTGSGRLEGTWDVQVTIRNCQTGAGIRTFQSVSQFMSGGTLQDVTSGYPPSQRVTGLGVWSQVSGKRYRFSFKSFSFDANGNFTGWQVIRHEATLDSRATEFTSAGIAEVYDPNGNLIFTGCSTTTATRFE
jgi:hypothetical protein